MRTFKYSSAPLNSPRAYVILAVILTLAIVALDLIFYPHTLEDAFITFRYSKHLAEGYGFGAWNVGGQRVEGYTNFLWMLLLAAGASLGIPAPTLSKVLGLVSHIGLSLALLFFPLFRKPELTRPDTLGSGDADAFTVSAIISAFYLPMTWYATSGMETLTFALLVCLCLLGPFVFRGSPVAMVVSVLLILMRPEGLFVALACIGYHLWHRRRINQSARPMAVVLVACLITQMLLTLFRMGVFGDILPNTYYAKVAGAGRLHIFFGKAYVQDWLRTHMVWVPAFLAALVFLLWSFWKQGLRTTGLLAFLFVFTTGYLGYIIKVGGDNPAALPFWRHFVHLIPFVAILLATGLNVLTPRKRVIRYMLLAGILAIVNVNVLYAENRRMLKDAQEGLAKYPNLSHSAPNQYIQWIKRIVGPDTTIATASAGELPYTVDVIFIDMLGLNDRDIAHSGRFDPYGPIDSKTNMDSVLRRRPDIIEGYYSGLAIKQGLPKEKVVTYRPQMAYQMFEHPIFQSEYLFLMNGPYEHMDRALFFHVSYWSQHPAREQLECVPVTKTSLCNRPANR
ncbi:MAG: hypothetical protein Kow0099_01070 [Candidatus Abyssubacteria bacterium]